MTYSIQLFLRAENRTLVQKIQYHLDIQELTKLNTVLCKFAEECTENRKNPTLTKTVNAVKKEFIEKNLKANELINY